MSKAIGRCDPGLDAQKTKGYAANEIELYAISAFDIHGSSLANTSFPPILDGRLADGRQSPAGYSLLG